MVTFMGTMTDPLPPSQWKAIGIEVLKFTARRYCGPWGQSHNFHKSFISIVRIICKYKWIFHFTCVNLSIFLKLLSQNNFICMRDGSPGNFMKRLNSVIFVYLCVDGRTGEKLRKSHLPRRISAGKTSYLRGFTYLLIRGKRIKWSNYK
jgi:hypothetical protein